MSDHNMIWLIKQLNISLDQYGRETRKAEALTPSESFVLSFLLFHKEQELCATDIHLKFGLSKASVSSVLKSLRQKGYLERKTAPGDDRRKQIVLTTKAFEAEKQVTEILKIRQSCLCRGIPEKNLDIVEDSLKKMILNLRKQT